MILIHVNRHIIAKNKKDGGNRPIYSIRDSKGGKVRYAREVEILGPSRMVYDPHRPLSCGATAWIVTYAEVKLKDEMTYQEVKELG